MSSRLKLVRSVGAVALLTQCAAVNALFTPLETEPFNFTTSQLTVTVVDGDIPGRTTQGLATILQPLTFDKFNTGLGDLLGVEVTYQSSFGVTTTVNATFEDIDPNQGSISFSAASSVQRTLTGSGLNQPSSTSHSVSCVIDETQPLNTCPDSDSTNGTFNSAAPISLLPLADFFGPGTFVLTATLDRAVTPDIDPNSPALADNSTMTSTVSTTWEGSVSVRFEYQENPTSTVPEPITLYLLLAGAGGIALSRRRVAFVHAKRRVS
jgi:hypothetical protein